MERETVVVDSAILNLKAFTVEIESLCIIILLQVGHTNTLHACTCM